LIIAIISWYIKTYNIFVALKNKVEEAWATIDVFLKKRYDLIPNLVETVKGYAKHESETLRSVIEARNIGMSANNPQAAMSAANGMASSLKTFLQAVAEEYPELKANAHFLDLQNQLKSLEAELESARRYYNNVVKQFNTKRERFPDKIVVSRMGCDYDKKPYFEITDPVERQNVKVSF
jgi:LemA protein